LLFAHLLEEALSRGGGFLLPPHGRLFVMLALTNLAENARALALLLEAAHRALEGLAFFDSDPRHLELTSLHVNSFLDEAGGK
jgi:hypothetical protein